MIDGFTIALLTAEFGQVWAQLGLRESRTTLGRDPTTDMRPLDDTASTKMCSSATHFRVGYNPGVYQHV